MKSITYMLILVLSFEISPYYGLRIGMKKKSFIKDSINAINF